MTHRKWFRNARISDVGELLICPDEKVLELFFDTGGSRTPRVEGDEVHAWTLSNVSVAVTQDTVSSPAIQTADLQVQDRMTNAVLRAF